MGKQRVFLDLKSGSCKRPGMRVVVVQNLGGKQQQLQWSIMRVGNANIRTSYL